MAGCTWRSRELQLPSCGLGQLLGAPALRCIPAGVGHNSWLQQSAHKPSLCTQVFKPLFGCLLVCRHNLDDLKAHCLKVLSCRLASADSAPAVLTSDSWRQLPGSVRELLLEGVLSAAHRCQSKPCTVRNNVQCPRGSPHQATMKGVRLLEGSHIVEELPSKERLLAWKGPGGFSAH